MTWPRILATGATALFLAACGTSDRTDQAALATTACQVQVRGELERQGVRDVRFSSSNVTDGKPDGWVVSGPADADGATRDYKCRVVPSAEDELRGKKVVSVEISR